MTVSIVIQTIIIVMAVVAYTILHCNFLSVYCRRRELIVKRTKKKSVKKPPSPYIEMAAEKFSIVYGSPSPVYFS